MLSETSDVGEMKFAAGSGVLGLMLASVGCSQAFVAPAGTGESHSFMKKAHSLFFPSVMKRPSTRQQRVCRPVWWVGLGEMAIHVEGIGWDQSAVKA